MKYLKKLIYALIPIIICIIFSIGLNVFLDKEIDRMMSSKDIEGIKNGYGVEVKDKGIAFSDYVNKNNDLIVQGSSELSANVDQVVTKMFPIEGYNKQITTYGRAHVQYLQHASILGSAGVQQENKDVVLINSLQWFISEGEVDLTNFQSSFSPVQFYSYLNNEKISQANKIKYAKRIEELLGGSKQYSDERFYAELFYKDTNCSNIAKVLLKPYYSIKEYIIKLKDKGLLYKQLLKKEEKKETIKKEIDWKEESIKAEAEGTSLANNNEFFILNTYYDEYYRDKLEDLEGYYQNVNLLKSKEFEDYELYLDTCIDLGIKPYIVLMPTNGSWYDYMGITKEERREFYSSVEAMAKEKGFDVLNLQEEEYNPYFMLDGMHLGWKGWLRVDEEIYNRYK